MQGDWTNFLDGKNLQFRPRQNIWEYRRYEHYPLSFREDFTYFEFESVGPKGIVRKVIAFEDMGNGMTNIAFGDKIGDDWTDEAETNNQDLVKVMATVVHAALIYSEKFPQKGMVARPLDKRRKKLYDAIVRRNFDEISKIFEILGFQDGQLGPYSIINDFGAIILFRKYA